MVVLPGGRKPTASAGAETSYDAESRVPEVPGPSFGPTGSGNPRHRQAIIRAVEFLVRSVHLDRHHVPWPIGFYFAKLWYHEQLYPLIFATAALGNYLHATRDQQICSWLHDH